jgi:hypothetical protein
MREPVRHTPCQAREQIIDYGDLSLLLHKSLLSLFVAGPSIQYNGEQQHK